jgi:leucyl-tRNA synthetase
MRYAARVRAFNDGHVSDGPKLGDETRTQLLRKLHQTIEKMTQEFSDRWHFNTGIAAIMELSNQLIAADAEMDKATGDDEAIAHMLESMILLLAPLAPYLAAELWEQIGKPDTLLRTAWPVANPLLAAEQFLEIPVQVNGKLRAVVKMPVDATEEQTLAAALKDDRVAAAVGDREVLRQVVVPRKLVNLVVK